MLTISDTQKSVGASSPRAWNRRRRFRSAILSACLVCLAFSPSAAADHAVQELISTGSNTTDAEIDATFRGASRPGTRVFFETPEPLVAADGDAAVDIYERLGSTTTLLSTGPLAANGDFDATFEGSSGDGTHVFFTTAEPLVAGDSDAGTDVYERFGAETLLVSTGPAGTTGNFSTFYGGASEDGTHVFFETFEPLVPEDTDAAFRDVYERSAGQTTLVSTGPGSNPYDPIRDNRLPNASFAGTSDDGQRVFFETPERLVDSDVDRSIDLYERSGGSTEHISIGPAGGNRDFFDASFSHASEDGGRVLFETGEPLVADDEFGNDVYERFGGQTTLVSTGPAGGGAGPGVSFGGASRDGTHVFFETSTSLVSADTDSSRDVYERFAGGTTLVSTGPAGGNRDFFDASFGGASEDGARVFFTTFESLVSADTDSSQDVYERSAGTTAPLSTGATGGNGAFDAFFDGASADGTRVFLSTSESLAGGDTDGQRDVYERFGGATTIVSGGLINGNGAFDASFVDASSDGKSAFFHSNEVLTNSDSDATQDVYVASIAPNYPRPGGASFLRVPLVPAYSECTSPNSTHVAPLDNPSCAPPLQTSGQLTTSTVGAGSASVLFRVTPGNSGTPQDEADVSLTVSASDVRKLSNQSDYVGKVLLALSLRITDRASGSGQTTPATVTDAAFSAPIDCVATGGSNGSNCNTTTTLDTLVPNFAREGKRTVISALAIEVKDAGPNPSITPPSGTCPYTCGSGDETVFLRQGLFAP